jgi:hypothetical protein
LGLPALRCGKRIILESRLIVRPVKAQQPADLSVF